MWRTWRRQLWKSWTVLEKYILHDAVRHTVLTQLENYTDLCVRPFVTYLWFIPLVKELASPTERKREVISVGRASPSMSRPF